MQHNILIKTKNKLCIYGSMPLINRADPYENDMPIFIKIVSRVIIFKKKDTPIVFPFCTFIRHEMKINGIELGWSFH